MEQIPERAMPSAPEAFVPSPPADAEVGEITVLGMLDALGAAHPHRVVLDDGDRQISPFVLGLMVRRLARAILDLAPTGPVGVCLQAGGMGIVATFAALAAGRDCVILQLDRLPDAARGCACLVRDPRDGASPPPGCAPVDVFLSCGAPYAGAFPDLPTAPAAAAAVRFGDPSGSAVPLTRLVGGGAGCPSPHPPASGGLSCPGCLGDWLGTLMAGGTVRIGTGVRAAG